MILQPIADIAEICHQKGIQDFILSPGSRCAPLTIALVRHPHITTRTIADERSAAFIALGMTLQTGKITGLVCTSGTAVLNYAPAVTEAYYQQIPLLILTADRPAEWVDQADGQTIRQNGIYSNHIKASYQLPSDYSHPDAVWAIERTISEAINIANTEPKGPVHINIPLREPFYPEPGEEILYSSDVKVIRQLTTTTNLDEQSWQELTAEFSKYKTCLLVAGQINADEANIKKAVEAFSNKTNTPVVADITANLHGVTHLISHQDFILAKREEKVMEALKPDLLITVGASVLSKNLKLFLRNHTPKAHWHIELNTKPADAFQSMTLSVPLKADLFFKELAQRTKHTSTDDYLDAWKFTDSKVSFFLQNFFRKKPLGEMEAIKEVMQHLPDNSILHLANSMSVRYANYFGATKNVRVLANRGTSGIDGSTSTAIGTALSTKQAVTLITGDMAFFYDRNAWWNKYIPRNIKVIVLNNHGGGIFRIIDGPNRQPELDEYFETTQKLTAVSLAQEFGLIYYTANNKESLISVLPSFFQHENAAILEIESDSAENTALLKELIGSFR